MLGLPGAPLTQDDLNRVRHGDLHPVTSYLPLLLDLDPAQGPLLGELVISTPPRGLSSAGFKLDCHPGRDDGHGHRADRSHDAGLVRP